MIAKLTKTVSAVFMSAMMLTSCSLVGEKYDMDSAEGIAKVKELIKSCVDTEKNKIYDIEWTEDVRERKLENILSCVSVGYIDSNNDRYWININLINGKFVPDKEPRKSGGLPYSYQLTTPLEVDAIDAAEIQKMTAEARELFSNEEDGNEYEYRSIEKFNISTEAVPLRHAEKWKSIEEVPEEYKQPQYSFELNYTKKGESSEYTGRHIVTNYYGVKFEVNDEGKVVFDD